MDTIGFEQVVDWLGSGEAKVEHLRSIRDAINVRLEVPPPPYWTVEGKNTVISLGDEEIELLKRGPAQKEQLRQFKEWVEEYVKPAADAAFPPDKAKEFQEGKVGLSDALSIILSLLDVDALQKLGEIVTQRDAKFVEENFDFGWIIDALLIIVKNQPGIQRLAKAFFGGRGLSMRPM